MFFFQGFPEHINRHPPCFRVLCIQVPHDRIELDVLLDKEMIEIVTDSPREIILQSAFFLVLLEVSHEVNVVVIIPMPLK